MLSFDLPALQLLQHGLQFIAFPLVHFTRLFDLLLFRSYFDVELLAVPKVGVLLLGFPIVLAEFAFGHDIDDGIVPVRLLLLAVSREDSDIHLLIDVLLGRSKVCILGQLVMTGQLLQRGALWVHLI